MEYLTILIGKKSEIVWQGKSPKSMKLKEVRVPNIWGGSTSLGHLSQIKPFFSEGLPALASSPRNPGPSDIPVKKN